MTAPMLFEGSTVDGTRTTLTVEDPTSPRTITLPDKDGTITLSSAGGGGKIDAEDGTAALPTFSFESDTTTGMFSPATGEIALSTGGVERVGITDGDVSFSVSGAAGWFGSETLMANGTDRAQYSTSVWGPVASAHFAAFGITANAPGASTVLDNTITMSAGPVATQVRLNLSGSATDALRRIEMTDQGTPVWELDVTNTSVDTVYETYGPDGTEALPAYSFTSQPDVGLRVSGDDLRISVDGAENAAFNGTSVNFRDTGTSNLMLTMGASGGSLRSGASTVGAWNAQGVIASLVGTEAAPSLRLNDIDSGFIGGTDVLSIVAGGAAGSTTVFNTTNTTFEFPVLVPNGTDDVKGFAFASDTDMGCYTTSSIFVCNSKTATGGVMGQFDLGAASSSFMWFDASVNGTGMTNTDGVVQFFTDGPTALTLTGTTATFAFPIRQANGMTSAPAYSFTDDVDMGLWRNVGTGALWLTSASTAADYSYVNLDSSAAFASLGVSTFGTSMSLAMSDGADVILTVDNTGGAGGTSTTTFSEEKTTFTDPILIPDTGPGLAFSSDEDMGLLYVSPGSMRLITDPIGGAEAYMFLAKAGENFGYFLENATDDIVAMTASPGTTLSSINWTISETGTITDYHTRWERENASNQLYWKNLRAYTNSSNFEGFQVRMSQTAGADIYLEALTNGTGDDDIDINVQSIGDSQAQIGTGGSTNYVNVDAQDGIRFATYGTGSGKPACSIGLSGRMWRDDAASGIRDNIEVCTKLADEGFAWQPMDALTQKGTSTLTDATATNTILFSITSQDFAAGTVAYTTVCIDATEQIMVRDTLDFVCFNDADTETCDFATGDPASLATGGATMVPSYDITTGTNTITFRVTADCSLTPTTLETEWKIEWAHGDSRVVTEQN
jgi:hypothetical protein